MNRTIIIIFAVIVILVAGLVGMKLFTNTPAPIGENPSLGDPTLPNYQQSEPSQTPAQTKADVQAAYESHIPQNDPENIQPAGTAVSGGYALQAYVGSHVGGAALLKYDSNQRTWIIVDPGGGAWSVEGLMSFGVPEVNAKALLAALNR